ncbi:MAG: lycopene cyclase family protein [Thermoflexales bacterium]|nr:lycopene cyclase family protein [Thermoflexales bacterium]
MAAEFDIVIAGAGAAGLSLAYHLTRNSRRNWRIALVDRAPKQRNDRTWCFWEVGQGLFEAVVFRQWDRVAFYSPTLQRQLCIAPYRYKMIRGADFYAYVEAHLAAQPNVTRCYGEIVAVEEEGDAGVVHLRSGEVIRGKWVFNSVLFAPPCRAEDARYHCLLQHFLGWVVEADQPVFDPTVATLMDFRIPQAGETRFVYVLPFDAHTALVEFTVFSGSLLPREVYAQGLTDYLGEQLGLQSYRVREEEYGVIPMTDAPLKQRLSQRVIQIGTAGGDTKASTGYTFQRIQRRTHAIACALEAGRSPHLSRSLWQRRHGLFDSVLLNVLDKRRQPGWRVFTDLFANNPPVRVLRFLDEDTSLLEDLRVMASVHLPTFLSATLDVLARKGAGALNFGENTSPADRGRVT